MHKFSNAKSFSENSCNIANTPFNFWLTRVNASRDIYVARSRWKLCKATLLRGFTKPLPQVLHKAYLPRYFKKRLACVLHKAYCMGASGSVLSRYLCKTHCLRGLSEAPYMKWWDKGKVRKRSFASNCMKCANLNRKIMFLSPAQRMGWR